MPRIQASYRRRLKAVGSLGMEEILFWLWVSRWIKATAQQTVAKVKYYEDVFWEKDHKNHFLAEHNLSRGYSTCFDNHHYVLNMTVTYCCPPAGMSEDPLLLCLSSVFSCPSSEEVPNPSPFSQDSSLPSATDTTSPGASVPHCCSVPMQTKISLSQTAKNH